MNKIERPIFHVVLSDESEKLKIYCVIAIDKGAYTPLKYFANKKDAESFVKKEKRDYKDMGYKLFVKEIEVE